MIAALLLSLVLEAPACTPVSTEARRWPVYCSCINESRSSHQRCLEDEYQACEFNAANSRKLHVPNCHDRAETRCNKIKEANFRKCNNAFPRR